MKEIKKLIYKKANDHSKKEFLRLCHFCLSLNSSKSEIVRCKKCSKNFLPSNYLTLEQDKINSLKDFNELYQQVDEIDPKDLIIGLTVIW